MRRILQKIAAGKTEDLGDVSTIADPSVIENLIEQRIGLDVSAPAPREKLLTAQA